MNAIDERPGDALISDPLPYEAWDPDGGLLWLKDGSATQTFSVAPRIVDTAVNDELAILRSGLTSALSQLPEGSMIQFLMIRDRSTPLSDQAITRWQAAHQGAGIESSSPRTALREARQELLDVQCEEQSLFQSRVYVTVKVASESASGTLGRTGPFAQIAFRRKRKSKLKDPSQIQKEADDLSTQLRSALEAQGFETRYVGGDERLGLIDRFLNPERSQVMRMGLDPTRTIQRLAEKVALTDFLESKDGLRLGRVPVRIGTLKALPDSSVPCLSQLFANGSEPLIFVLTALILPQTAERERLLRKQRVAQGLAGGNRVRNIEAETQLQELEETLTAMIATGEKLLAASLHLICIGESLASAAKFATTLTHAEQLGPGCQWFEETVGAHPVFFATLPFAPTFMPRPKRMLTSSLSDFLPLFGTPAGHEKAEVIFESAGGSLVGFSLFEKSPSANAILIGSTGSGKSTLACGLILGMAAGSHEDAPSNFVIDVGNSFKRSILYLGGASLDLSPEKGTRINPFDLPAGARAPDPEKVKFLTAFFDEVLGDQGSLSKLERSLLETEILKFYEQPGLKHLSRFREHLEKSGSEDLRRMAQLLALWCNPHPYGLLFDGDTNVELQAPHLHFELKGCQRYPDLLRVAMLVVMDLIWREVRSRFPSRSLIVIDEAHTVIRPSGDGRSNSSARWVEDLFRQMRKFGSAAIAISQAAHDLKNDEIGDGILANAPNRFILRQRGDERTLREDLKLNDEELKAVFSLQQLRGAYSEFFLHSESIKSVLAYRPTPLELWLSTTHPPDLELLDEVASAHPEWNLPTLMQNMAVTYPRGAEARRNGVGS